MSKAAICVILILYHIRGNNGIVDIEKVTCTMYDKNFSRFDLCELRWTKQKLPSVSIKIHLFQLPVTNCDVHLELKFLSSKFTPTVFNNTWDACHFMENTKRYRSLLLFYNLISNFTNLNHTCPYNHDIDILNFQPGRISFPMPLPKGDYLLKTQYSVDKKLRLAVDINTKYN